MSRQRKSSLDGMTSIEKRAALSLASVYGLRMFGLFMILPVFAIYAEGLRGVTHTLMGIALGAYGLTQAALQIPFGMLSDRIGRKPVIIGGLLLFAVGSAIAAMADSVWQVIIGRAVQGSGAIAAAVMALNADLTREQHRTKAMGLIGVTIGVSFSIALVTGPVLNQWIGVPGLFWLTGVLALAGVAVVAFVVPHPDHCLVHRDTEAVPASFGEVLRNPELLRLDLGILLLHMILTSTFVAVPLALRDLAGMPANDHWHIYLPVLLLSFLGMVPFVIVAEKYGRMKAVFLVAVLTVAVAQLALAFNHDSVWSVGMVLLLFFIAFNVLEATLPSLVSKIAPPQNKGTAMGIYSSVQFLGAALGGALGGWLYGGYGPAGVFLVSAGMGLLWFVLAAGMRSPSQLSTYLLAVGTMDEAQARALAGRLLTVRGVMEAWVEGEEGVAYLKVNSHELDQSALEEFGSS